MLFAHVIAWARPWYLPPPRRSQWVHMLCQFTKYIKWGRTSTRWMDSISSKTSVCIYPLFRTGIMQKAGVTWIHRVVLWAWNVLPNGGIWFHQRILRSGWMNIPVLFWILRAVNAR